MLELLVERGRPLTMSEICQLLGRSQGAMFRMVQVLQSRGFIEQDRASDGYFLTGKLFSMAMSQPPVQGIVEVALPVMRELAMQIGQSCHLVLHVRGEIVVVARMESDEQIGFSVRVGHRRLLVESVSGALLFGFQPPETQDHWLNGLPKSVSKAEIDEFVARSRRARKLGHALAKSTFTGGVIDISAPVMRGDRAVAALTVPFIKHANLRCDQAEVVRKLVEAARQMSEHLIENDSRI